MMGARELLPVFFSYCRRMLRAFLLVALGGATLFVVTILYRAPLELPLYTCCLVGAVGAVFFFSGFVNTVPVTLEEAAYIDGASPFTTFIRIVYPLLKPPMVTLLIVIALRVWNNFMYPLLLLQGQNSRTLPLTVFFFKGDLSIQWNILFAATTLVILPLMIVYFILQKQIISGMLNGSVKG